MPSVLNLSPSAADHRRAYTHPESNRALAAYDRMGPPGRLDPVDFLAPAMLQAPVRGEFLIEIHRSDNPYTRLRGP